MVDSFVSVIVFILCFSAYTAFQFAYKSWIAPLAFTPYVVFYQGGLDEENYRSLISQGFFGFEVLLTYIYSHLPDFVAFRLFAVLSVYWYFIMFGLFVHAYVQNKTSRQLIFLYNFGFPFGAIYAFSSFRQFVALGFIFLFLVLAKSKKSNSIGASIVKVITVIFAFGSHITAPIVIINIFKQYTIFAVLAIIFIASTLITELGLFTSYLRLQTSNLNFYGTILSTIMLGVISFLGGYSSNLQRIYLMTLILGCILSLLNIIAGVLFLRVLVYVLPFLLVQVFRERHSINYNVDTLAIGYSLSFIWITVLLIGSIDRPEFHFNML